LRVTIPTDHRLEVEVRLPEDFPPGPAELILLAGSPKGSLTETASEAASGALQILGELRSFERTEEEERVLEDFEAFRREHPVRLLSLDED
jgi:hypothetical protein